MKTIHARSTGTTAGHPWWKLGSRLLGRVDQQEPDAELDAPYRVWEEGDRLGWLDTQREGRRGAATAAAVQQPFEAPPSPVSEAASDPAGDFADPWCDGVSAVGQSWPDDLRRFENEIEQWRQQRMASTETPHRPSAEPTEVLPVDLAASHRRS